MGRHARFQTKGGIVTPTDHTLSGCMNVHRAVLEEKLVACRPNLRESDSARGDKGFARGRGNL